jgi:hypothetical protein
MLIIGRELGNGFFTGREQRFTGEFLGTDTQNLSQLITTYLKEGKIQREIRQFITGDFGEGTRQGREFMDSAKRLLPQLGAVYARGLMLFGGE